jgi:hypothetical protein
MKKVVIENLMLEKTNDDYFSINTHDRKGNSIKIEITAKTALEIARVFLNWVCAAWLE